MLYVILVIRDRILSMVKNHRAHKYQNLKVSNHLSHLNQKSLHRNKSRLNHQSNLKMNHKNHKMND